jgi:hypothetical protein
MLITAELFDKPGLDAPPEAVQCPCKNPSGEIELVTHALVRKGVLLAYCEAISANTKA